MKNKWKIIIALVLGIFLVLCILSIATLRCYQRQLLNGPTSLARQTGKIRKPGGR
jgi:hypothetical protein